MLSRRYKSTGFDHLAMDQGFARIRRRSQALRDPARSTTFELITLEN